MTDLIASNPSVCHGKPSVKGTRIMVANILSLKVGGYSEEQIADYYPSLKVDDIRAILEQTKHLIPEEEPDDE